MNTNYNYFNAKIKNAYYESDDVKTFILEKPKNFIHQPGQFCWLTLPSSLKKSDTDIPKVPMAIASGTNESKLIFSFKNWGNLTQELFKLKTKDTIAVSLAMGTYLPFNNFISSKIYLIAGGTGITPIRSLLFSIKSKKENYKLFYGVKSPKDFLYKDDLKNWDVKFIVEKSDTDNQWEGDFGFVTSLLPKNMEIKNGLCYICGPYPMMQNVVSLLKNIGFSEDQIYVSIEKMENDQVLGPVFLVSDLNITF